MGTLAYMSPEQVQGIAVDHRTDLWSLGVVLYEMLTGQRPFDAEYKPALLYSILHAQPTPITVLRPDLPPGLEQIVSRLLEKNPQDRFSTAADLLSELRRLRSSASRQRRRQIKPAQPTDRPAHLSKQQQRSILVLPFEDLSPHRDNAYFNNGLTEEILTELSSVPALRVVSRSSAMMLKAARKDIKTIGRELNVGYVLEGSVRKAANQLRVTVQLVDSTTDVLLWAAKYTETLDDVFDAQENLSAAIVQALKRKLVHA